MDLSEFLLASRKHDVWWWLDPESGEVVTECRECGVEARHTPQELDNHFSFAHQRWCPAVLGVPVGRA